MEKPSAGGLLGFLIVVLALQAGLMLGKGALLLNLHEGDAMHVIEIILRMEQGQWPHLDFMTPLGLMAFAPIAWLASFGIGVGHAIMGGFVLFGAVLLPAVWWSAMTRLSGWVAYAYGGFLMVLSTALAYGGPDISASISMYYNRWGWAVAFVLVVMAVLPSRRDAPIIDGVIFGVGLAFLALTKITFFVAFLPGILLALMMRRQGVTLLAGLIAGLAVAGLVTVFGGVDYWWAYLSDLREISNAPFRAAPGESLLVLLSSSSYWAMNLCLLAGVILLRQAGMRGAGAVLLLFAPAFIYVTYQNWGNDPKWLVLLAVIMMAARPERPILNGLGWDVGRSMGVVALLSGAFILPSVMTLTLTNFRYIRMATDDFVPILKGAADQDVMMRASRMYAPAKRIDFRLNDPIIDAVVGDRKTIAPPDTLFGQPLPQCELKMGLIAVLQAMSHRVDAIAGTAGKSVFIGDVYSSLWLFGKTVPVKNGAPWYYGGIEGMQNADFILIPTCPVGYKARTEVLKNIKNHPEIRLREVSRNDLFILLQRLPD